MSKRRRSAANGEVLTTEAVAATDTVVGPSRASAFTTSYRYLRQRLWLVAAILVVALGTLGSTMKYLQEDAVRQNALRSKDRSLLSAINPYVTSPVSTPTPQLSKEYIYAGSRLLAVEDANANAAPPADLAVWRPSTGVWWVLGGVVGSQQTSFQWGQDEDAPVPGDFDGDGKTDFSILRETTGESEWWIFRSSDNTSTTIAYGQTGDRPAVGDYDGDGRSDAALYRPSNGTWYITRSSDNTSYQVQFGLANEDLPAPGDFDGDGKADIAVYRGSNTTFYTYRSSDLTVETTNINSTGTPVPADYDGDGRANYAVRSGADWKILSAFPNIITGSGTPQSSESIHTVSWETGGDIAVNNDYDGDGIVDIAVWRPTDSPSGTLGYWYIRQSSKLGLSGQTPTTGNPHPNELRAQQWGILGDQPVPAYYRR